MYVIHESVIHENEGYSVPQFDSEKVLLKRK